MAFLRHKRSTAHEEGDVSPLTLAFIAGMLVLSGLVVDVGMAAVVQQTHANDLAAARDEMLAAPTALMLKNADDPGMFTAETLVDSLRDNGYEGEVTVWYYEAAASQVPADKRALAWAVQTESAMPSYFLRFADIAEIPLGSFTVGSAMPYSLGTTWRPADTGNGRYVAAAGATSAQIDFSPADSAAQCPAELVEALQARIDEAQAS